MSDQMHVGTFLWGAVLAIAGAALAAVGFGWWDLAAFDLRYAAPVFVILVGGVILAGAFARGGRARSDTDRNG
jgi:hypothetical protein